MSEFIQECKDLLDEYGDLEVEDDNGRAVDIEHWFDDREQAFIIT